MLQKEHNIILYIRSKKYMHLRWKDAKTTDFVHISDSEFSLLPGFSKEALDGFIISGIIKTKPFAKDGVLLLRYSVDFNGEIDLSLLRNNRSADFPLGGIMKEHLMNTGLEQGVPQSEYFEGFLRHRDKYMDAYFIVDGFSGRIHTPISIMKGEYRKSLLLYNQPTSSLDVITMQPLILAKVLENEIGKNDFSNLINSGEDIYLILKNKARLVTRDEAKNYFYSLIFGKSDKRLYLIYGHVNWVTWINNYKTIINKNNPKSNHKPHSNLAWLMQKLEVQIMREVWGELILHNIPFLTVHDEIIITKKDEDLARQLFENVLSNYFTYFCLK